MSQRPGEGAGSLSYATPHDQARTSGLAIASLVLGIVAILTSCIGLGQLLGVVAIVLGIIGITKTGTPNVRGRGMAIAGLSCGAASIVLILPLMLAIMLPSLNRAREAANRVKCGANLRQIGQAAVVYGMGDAQTGMFPADEATLLANSQLVPAVFLCPTSSTAGTPAPPPFVPGQNTDYVYLGGGMRGTVPPTTVLAYCDHNHGVDGTNVLYADGAVRFEDPTTWPAVVAATAPPTK